MKTKNKKIIWICMIIIIITTLISTVAIIFKPTNLDRFIKYDETKYRYTRFDTTIYDKGTTINTMIRPYRKIDNSIKEDYLKKLSAKIEDVDDYINYVKEQNELSKDNIMLMKNIKTLSDVKYIDTLEVDAVVNVIIQDDNIFTKVGNIYEARLKLYLKDEIIALEDVGTMGKDNSGKIIYYKMDISTIELVNKIIYDAKNQ